MMKFEEMHRCLSKMPVRFVAEAISCRIPLRVKKVCYFSEAIFFPMCPKCNSTLEREYAKYCDRCGQRLNWHALDSAEVCYTGGRDHL